MWPYINQEDLIKTKALPLLLNARGRHHPSHCADADIEAMRLGLVTKAIVPISLDGYVMILNDASENIRDYGKLMAWEERPDTFDSIPEQNGFKPEVGI